MIEAMIESDPLRARECAKRKLDKMTPTDGFRRTMSPPKGIPKVKP